MEQLEAQTVEQLQAQTVEQRELQTVEQLVALAEEQQGINHNHQIRHHLIREVEEADECLDGSGELKK